MLLFLTAGIVLGFSAGVAPGPLLALIIAETLQHNLKAGIKVALAPIITDLPIVMLTLLILSRLSHFQTILGAISIFGGLFIVWLGWQNLCIAGVNIEIASVKENALRKGIITNFLSPHPYLFWFSVGAPATVRAMDHSGFAAAAFIGSFYGLLVGSKIAIAVIVGKSRSFLAGRSYIYTMRGLGVILVGFGALLVYDGLKLISPF
ncbi:MAG: LysE family translocator [Desulfobacteraceae bacterium]|nr:MAG: LysE family translocator [Desulfobacteraceae bacterium]